MARQRLPKGGYVDMMGKGNPGLPSPPKTTVSHPVRPGDPVLGKKDAGATNAATRQAYPRTRRRAVMTSRD